MTKNRQSGADVIIRSFENAISLWQKDVKLMNGVHRFEAININGNVLLVQDYPNGDGWQVYKPVTDQNGISETLAEIAHYCHANVKLIGAHDTNKS